jgi:hypothetical protein
MEQILKLFPYIIVFLVGVGSGMAILALGLIKPFVKKPLSTDHNLSDSTSIIQDDFVLVNLLGKIPDDLQNRFKENLKPFSELVKITEKEKDRFLLVQDNFTSFYTVLDILDLSAQKKDSYCLRSHDFKQIVEKAKSCNCDKLIIYLGLDQLKNYKGEHFYSKLSILKEERVFSEIYVLTSTFPDVSKFEYILKLLDEKIIEGFFSNYR